MAFLGKKLDQLEVSDLRNLIGTARENRALDFKAELPGGTRAERKEFLADVSSFANAAGGHLVYGMTEDEGVAASFQWLAGNLDQTISRLENMIRDGLEPRLPRHGIEVIDGDEGAVLILEIPRSWAALHAVKLGGGGYRFFARNANGKYQLDLPQIRSALGLAENLRNRLSAFRGERVAAIDAGQAAVPLEDGARVVLHLIPFTSAEPESVFDLRYNYPPPVGLGAYTQRHSFDGALSVHSSQRQGAAFAYALAFRSGALEVVEVFDRREDLPLLPTAHIEKSLEERVRKYSSWQSELGVEPPLVVAVSLLDVEGFMLHSAGLPRTAAPIDRRLLLLPPVIMEDFTDDVESLLQEPINTLWNAGGWPESETYGSKG